MPGNISIEAVEEMIKIASMLSENQGILYALEEATTSCVKWGATLQSLFIDGSLDVIHMDTHDKPIQARDFVRIEKDLMQGKSIFIEVKLPGGNNHVFTIVGDKGKARVLHAWQDMHSLRAERSMPIDDMVVQLEELSKYDYTIPGDIPKFREVRQKLWGPNHIEPVEIETCPRTKVVYNTVASGTPKYPLIECKETLERLSIELSECSSILSGGLSDFDEEFHFFPSGRSSVLSEEFQSFYSGSSSILSDGINLDPFIKANRNIKIRNAALFGTAFGFLLGAVGALYNDEEWKDVLKDGVKSATALGVGGVVGGTVSKSVRSITVDGIRASSAAGAAMFSVFAVWDIAEWYKHNMTGVELRKKLVKGAGGAAVGVAGAVGGAEIGAAGGTILGPAGLLVGGIIGGIIGGVAGGFVGTAAGKAIDKAIWDESEDSIMNCYEFFGWHGVRRGTRPKRSEKDIKEAYLKRLDENPSKKIKKEDWSMYCIANILVLLRAMFPDFKKMLEISEKFINQNSKGVSIIGTSMHNSTLDAQPSITTQGTQVILNGTFLIENVETGRYLSQNGELGKGKREGERSWSAQSHLEFPNVVGSDEKYSEYAFWRITYKGKGIHLIKNVATKRFLFLDEESMHRERDTEGGWKAHSGFQSPRVVCSDANYCNRASWCILHQENNEYIIQNVVTGRYLFQDGEPIKGKTSRLTQSGFEHPSVVGADVNYNNRAHFKFVKID